MSGNMHMSNPLKTAEECLAKALEMDGLVASAKTEAEKLGYQRLAQSWREIAEQVKRQSR
jgi:hypothetical protein